MTDRHRILQGHVTGRPEPVSHCWADNGDEDTYTRATGTCMLLDGHDGPHEFTPDDEIMVSVTPEPELVTCENGPNCVCQGHRYELVALDDEIMVSIAPEPELVTCDKCGGRGFTEEHAPMNTHSPRDGSCLACPIQVQCDRCLNPRPVKGNE